MTSATLAESAEQGNVIETKGTKMYYVIWRLKNGKMKEQKFERYWEARQKMQALKNAGYTDISMQEAKRP